MRVNDCVEVLVKNVFLCEPVGQDTQKVPEENVKQYT